MKAIPIRLTLGLLLALVQSLSAQLVNSEWNTGNGTWNTPTNWFPNDVPDNGGGITYDVSIGNRPVAANALVTYIPEDSTADSISSLTMSGGADLVTNGFQLFVVGQTTVSGVGSSIRVDPHATPGTIAFDTDNLDITGGAIQMRGGLLNVDVLMEINSGSVVQGFGTVNVGDADGVVEAVFENSGLVQLSGNPDTPGTLTLQANGVDTLNLDGTTDTGVVDVANVSADLEVDSNTLIVDGPLSDPFSGTLQIGQRDTVTFNNSFTMDGAELQMDGGSFTATMNGPAAVTNIQNSAFTITGDAVIGNNLTFAGPANSVTINAASSLTFEGAVSMPPLNLNLAALNSELIVGGSLGMISAGEALNWDGPGTATTTVKGNGSVSFSVDQIDTTDNVFGGTLNLNDSADAAVNVTATAWTLAGSLNKNNAGTSILSGDRVVVTGSVNVNAGTLDLPATTLNAGSDIAVAGLLTLGGASEFAGPTTLTGAGTLRMEGTSTVAASTTIGVNTFDYDGLGTGTLHTINDGAVLTINSPVLDSDGDMDDPISLGGNGAQLIVSGPAEWTLNGVLTANAAAAGTATIGGTSRLVLTNTVNVDGNTNFAAPTTFSSGSTASIDAAMTLNATNIASYAGTTISGLGTYDAGSQNTVTASSTINPSNFNFDAGTWLIQDNALLTLNVGDYDPDAATNAFGATISLLDGDISVTTGDAEFVLDGTLNMNTIAPGGITLWTGEPLDIGNDAGVLDANVNVTGTGISRFGAQVDFNSDADVEVGAGAELSFTGAVNFDTVNAANNAEFTGAGEFSFSEAVNVNEAVTLNLVGGVVDLDGSDAVGDFVNIDAPLVINAELLRSFGRVNGAGGVNILDINNSVGTGTLTVNLDDPAAEWTLNSAGVMNLVNDNTAATLLAGSDVNLRGTVNVVGDVRTTAQIDIGSSAVLNILTAAQPLRLAGGNNVITPGDADPNTITGGVINGPGILGADTTAALQGFGTINADLDFDGSGNLRADGGILTVNGAILDAFNVGTADTDGILNIPAAWNSGTVTFVSLLGGELRGGTVTLDNAQGITGTGLVASRVINNSRIHAAPAATTLVVETAANDNDWDGAAGTGILSTGGGILELRDNATFGFSGTVTATAGGRVFSNNFALDFNLGSTINLTGSTYQSTNSTDIGGTVTVGAGADSAIQVQTNRFLTFEPTSVTTLNANLRLVTNNGGIDAGATFGGTGALIVPDNSHITADANATINVLLGMQGTFRPGGINAVGRVDVRDYQQSSTGGLVAEIEGTGLNQFDRLVVNGAAQLAGSLEIDIDGGFVPTVGQTFDILTASGGVTGKFTTVTLSDMPAELGFAVTYPANAVRLTVINVTPYLLWINTFGALTAPADKLPAANPDGDALDNLAEFALDSDPTSGTASGKIVGKIAPVGGIRVLTLTFPVRTGAIADPADPAGGQLVLEKIADGVSYAIQAADNLTDWTTLTVNEVTGGDAAAIQAGLPAVNPGWVYRTFRSPGPVVGDPVEFIRVGIDE